jgi:uncharacterized membrane protein HdeD (DUF308 family)
MQKLSATLLLSGILAFVFAFPILSSPRVAEAASFPYWGPLISCTGNNPDITNIPNPTDSKGNTLPRCASICDILLTAQNIFFFLLTLALIVFAPLSIITGAVLMIISAGSPEKVTQGRSIITNTLLGILFVLCAFVIVNSFFFLASKFLTSGKGLPQKWYAITCSPTKGITVPQ